MAMKPRCAAPSCQGIRGPVGRYGVCRRCCMPLDDETANIASTSFDDVFGRPVADHVDLPDLQFNYPADD